MAVSNEKQNTTQKQSQETEQAWGEGLSWCGPASFAGSRLCLPFARAMSTSAWDLAAPHGGHGWDMGQTSEKPG